MFKKLKDALKMLAAVIGIIIFVIAYLAVATMTIGFFILTFIWYQIFQFCSWLITGRTLYNHKDN